MALPIEGPDADRLPATTVDSIKELLALCRELEKSAPETHVLVYRGQTSEFFIGSTRQVSLLPSLARPPQTRHLAHHTLAMEQGYRKYLKEVVLPATDSSL